MGAGWSVQAGPWSWHRLQEGTTGPVPLLVASVPTALVRPGLHALVGAAPQPWGPGGLRGLAREAGTPCSLRGRPLLPWVPRPHPQATQRPPVRFPLLPALDVERRAAVICLRSCVWGASRSLPSERGRARGSGPLTAVASSGEEARWAPSGIQRVWDGACGWGEPRVRRPPARGHAEGSIAPPPHRRALLAPRPGAGRPGGGALGTGGGGQGSHDDGDGGRRRVREKTRTEALSTILWPPTRPPGVRWCVVGPGRGEGGGRGARSQGRRGKASLCAEPWPLSSPSPLGGHSSLPGCPPPPPPGLGDAERLRASHWFVNQGSPKAPSRPELPLGVSELGSGPPLQEAQPGPRGPAVQSELGSDGNSQPCLVLWTEFRGEKPRRTGRGAGRGPPCPVATGETGLPSGRGGEGGAQSAGELQGLAPRSALRDE